VIIWFEHLAQNMFTVFVLNLFYTHYISNLIRYYLPRFKRSNFVYKFLYLDPYRLREYHPSKSIRIKRLGSHLCECVAVLWTFTTTALHRSNKQIMISKWSQTLTLDVKFPSETPGSIDGGDDAVNTSRLVLAR